MTAEPAAVVDRPAHGGHMPALDGMRGLAIIMVLFVHFIGDSTPGTALERGMVKLANYGVWGVDLFFVLSGFLITGILYDARERPRYYRNFYVRRVLRIFPLYYGVLALLFVVLPALPVAYPASLVDAEQHQRWLWPYATNVYVSLHHGWTLPYVSHFWSLAVEEHFYLFWPLVVATFSRNKLLWICASVAAFALVLRCVMLASGASDVAVTALTPCRLDALCVGGFLAIASRAVGIQALARVARPWAWVMPGLVLATSAWNALTGGVAREVVVPLRGTFVALSFGALLVVTVAGGRAGVLGRVFRAPVMRFFGKYSYGLYVFHGIVAFALVERGTERVLGAWLGSHLAAVLLQATVGAAFSLLVSVASYELFEKHFLRLKDYFAPGVVAQKAG